LLVPAGVQGPGFLMLSNFRAIMKYNPAEAYALAIGHFADRCAAANLFAQDWPRYERVLSHGERLELQQLLARTATISASPTHLRGQDPRRNPRFPGQIGQVRRPLPPRRARRLRAR